MHAAELRRWLVQQEALLATNRIKLFPCTLQPKKQKKEKGPAPVGVVDVDLVALHRGVPPHALADAGLEALQIAEHATCGRINQRYT